jgi:phosphoglycerate kinase
VSFYEDCIGPVAARASPSSAGPGSCSNLRFHAGEEDDADFAKALAELADCYVNDAFGAAHRAHASTAGITRHVDSVAAGDLLRSELDHLRVVLEPARPLLVILGGAKVSDKLAVLEALAPHADALLIGGAMAYTFLAARGEPVGASLVEPDRIEDARRVVRAAEQSGCQLLLPTDHVIAQKIAADSSTRVVKSIPDGWLGVDIGPETAARYAAEIARARTLFWNGPMGVFEIEAFAAGTAAVARAVAASAATTVVGGGDSLAAINQLGLGDRITHPRPGAALARVRQGLGCPASRRWMSECTPILVELEDAHDRRRGGRLRRPSCRSCAAPKDVDRDRPPFTASTASRARSPARTCGSRRRT